MANLERKVYDPRTDNIRSLDFEDEERSDQEGARLPLLVVLALLVLAAFSGVVWLAYTQGIERGRAEGPESLAAQTVHKAPANSLPFLGLNIYQAPANGRAQKVAGPVHPPAAPPTLRPTSNGGPESFAAGTEPAHPFAARTAAAVPGPNSVKPATEKLARSNALPTQNARPSTQAPAATRVPLPSQLQVKPAPPNSVSSSTVAAPNSTPKPAQLNGILLQIGSYKSAREAQQSWQAFQAKHSAARGYQPDIRQVDLGAKGRWYRLRIGPFTDKDAAAEACARLRSDGASCLIAR